MDKIIYLVSNWESNALSFFFHKLARFGGIVRTRPANNTEKYATGPRLTHVSLTANYIRLKQTPKWQIVKYSVAIEPECQSRGVRNYLLAQNKEQLGGYLFDGLQLFVTKQLHLENGERVLKANLPRENVCYVIRLKFTKVVRPDDDEFHQILNLILRRATSALDLQLVNRKFYDAQAAIVSISKWNRKSFLNKKKSPSVYRIWAKDSDCSCGQATKHRFASTNLIFSWTAT